MPPPSDPRLLVLHGLRLKGFAEAAGVAEVVGVPTGDVEKHLDALAADGLALHRDGRLTGWSLTATGRAEHERGLADELEEAGCRADVDAAYRGFLALNTDLLGVCTAWQLKGEALNDHSNAAYDQGVIDQLGTIHDQLQPVLQDLTGRLARYGGYAARFDAAIDRLRSGDRDYFTKPMIDSYHTIWFELHEDLLSTLGIERSKETTP